MPVRWLANVVVWHEFLCESGFLFDILSFLFGILRLSIQAQYAWIIFVVHISIGMGIEIVVLWFWTRT